MNKRATGHEATITFAEHPRSKVPWGEVTVTFFVTISTHYTRRHSIRAYFARAALLFQQALAVSTSIAFATSLLVHHGGFAAY